VAHGGSALYFDEAVCFVLDEYAYSWIFKTVHVYTCLYTHTHYHDYTLSWPLANQQSLILLNVARSTEKQLLIFFIFDLTRPGMNLQSTAL